MKLCLSTLFDQYDGLWGVFTVKKTRSKPRLPKKPRVRVRVLSSFRYRIRFTAWGPSCECNLYLNDDRTLTLPLTLTLGVGVRVGVGLWLVYLVLEHEVFRKAGLISRDKILCSDWSPPLLDEELACRHVAQDKLFFKNAALYVTSCVESFFSVKVMGKYVIQTWVSYDKRGI